MEKGQILWGGVSIETAVCGYEVCLDWNGCIKLALFCQGRMLLAKTLNYDSQIDSEHIAAYSEGVDSVHSHPADSAETYNIGWDRTTVSNLRCAHTCTPMSKGENLIYLEEHFTLNSEPNSWP